MFATESRTKPRLPRHFTQSQSIKVAMDRDGFPSAFYLVMLVLKVIGWRWCGPVRSAALSTSVWSASSSRCLLCICILQTVKRRTNENKMSAGHCNRLTVSADMLNRVSVFHLHWIDHWQRVHGTTVLRSPPNFEPSSRISCLPRKWVEPLDLGFFSAEINKFLEMYV